MIFNFDEVMAELKKRRIAAMRLILADMANDELGIEVSAALTLIAEQADDLTIYRLSHSGANP